VFVGAMWNDYQLYGAGRDLANGFAPASAYLSTISNRVSYCLNLTGPSMTVDTLCSSSLVAIHMACESIRRGESQLAIAGGVNFTVHPVKYLRLSHMQMVSPTGRCHSFGAAADGYVPGEGVGAILIKPLEAAQRDGDHVYGVIRGSAVRHGGKTGGYTVPSPSAQSALIEEVLRRSDTDPRTISYVEAHGTGTALGDPIEFQGLVKAFGPAEQRKAYCALGSLKSNIGHLEAAAGIAGITKVLLQMDRKALVPTLHAGTVNPKIQFDGSPFFLQKSLTEWHAATPRRAAISSFGAGGVNCHLILEQAPEAHAKPLSNESDTEELIVLSARSRDALLRGIRNLHAYLARHETERSIALRDIAYTLQAGREEMEYRYAVVVRDLDELRKALLEALAQGGHEFAGIRRAQPRPRSDDDVRAAPSSGREGLRDLGARWQSGGSVDWRRLRKPGTAKRISLPTYAFDKTRYWVNGVAPAMAAESVAAPSIKIQGHAPQSVELGAAGKRLRRSTVPKASIKRSKRNKEAGTVKLAAAISQSESARDLAAGVAKVLREAVGRELKIEPSRIEPERPLTDYGIDSVKAMALTTRLESISGRLPAMLLFEYSSVGRLADYLSEHHGEKWAEHIKSLGARVSEAEPTIVAEVRGREAVG
jgi:acyl transferase domain-containing protein